MTEQVEFREVINSIKNVMRGRKITYRMLAKQIGLSESSVKKLFIGKDCSLGRLNDICSLLNLRMVDILSAIDDRGIFDFTFSSKQQEFFMAHTDCFHFYWKLVYERMSVDDIQRVFKLSRAQLFRYLRSLDQLNLIKLQPNDRVQIPRVQAIRWGGSGAFLKKLKEEWATQTVKGALGAEGQSDLNHFTLQYFQLSESSQKELAESLKNLELEFAKRTARELNLGKAPLVCTRFVSALVPGSFVEKTNGCNKHSSS